MIIEKNVKLIIMLNAIQDNDKLVPYYKTEKVELLSETRYSSNLLFRKFTLKKKEIHYEHYIQPYNKGRRGRCRSNDTAVLVRLP